MNIKKIQNLVLCFIIIFSTIGCSVTFAEQSLDAKKREIRRQIKRTKMLENLEKGKLYQNQQKLENATNNLEQSKSQIAVAQKKLINMQSEYERANTEYTSLNTVLAKHIRTVFKCQRKAFLELLITSEDINTLVDRIYFQKIILKDDYDKMDMARKKARELALLKYSIESQKLNLERDVASINTQQAYIKRAIKRNEDMIYKLKNDKIAYERAERNMEHQSKSVGSYINRAVKDEKVYAASGFIKPIAGRITSPFGYRTHPIFNTRSFHSGVDIGGQNYGAIHASNSGKVIYSGWYGGYGKVVIVEHGMYNGKPISTLYAHMSTIKVANGQQVTKGQVIGFEGTTGYSTGPHCHFEVRVNGQPSNPASYVAL